MFALICFHSSYAQSTKIIQIYIYILEALYSYFHLLNEYP
jgi:hypothetical protein